MRAERLQSRRAASRGDVVRRGSDQQGQEDTLGHHAWRAHPRHLWQRHVRAQPESPLRPGVSVEFGHHRARVRGQVGAEGEEDGQCWADLRRDRWFLQLGVVAGGEFTQAVSYTADLARFHRQSAQRQD